MRQPVQEFLVTSIATSKALPVTLAPFRPFYIRFVCSPYRRGVNWDFLTVNRRCGYTGTFASSRGREVRLGHAEDRTRLRSLFRELDTNTTQLRKSFVVVSIHYGVFVVVGAISPGGHNCDAVMGQYEARLLSLVPNEAEALVEHAMVH